jgi:hypothetical protein
VDKRRRSLACIPSLAVKVSGGARVYLAVWLGVPFTAGAGGHVCERLLCGWDGTSHQLTGWCGHAACSRLSHPDPKPNPIMRYMYT